MLTASSLYATLGLFFVSEHLSHQLAFQTAAEFLALIAMAGIVCGFVIDRWVSYSHSVILGLFLYASGMGLLLFQPFSVQLFGLALSALGIGFYVPAVQVLLNRQVDDSSLRHKVVQFNYVVKNVGAFLGLFMAGLLPGFWMVHAIGLLMLLISALSMMACRKQFLRDTGTQAWFFLGTFCFGLLLILYAMLQYQLAFEGVFIIIGGLLVAFLLFMTAKTRDLNYLKYLFFVAGVAVTYHMVSALYFVVYGVLIKSKLQHVMPPSWILAIDPLTIILLGSGLLYLFSKKQLPFSARCLIGLLGRVLTILCMMTTADEKDIGIAALLAMSMMAISELFIMPSLIVRTTELVPAKQHAMFMGFTRGCRGIGFAIFAYMCQAVLPTKLTVVGDYNMLFYVLMSVVSVCAGLMIGLVVRRASVKQVGVTG